MMPMATPIRKPRTIFSPFDPLVTSCKILSPTLKSPNPFGVDPQDVIVGSVYVVEGHVVGTPPDEVGVGVVDGVVATDAVPLVTFVLVMVADSSPFSLLRLLLPVLLFLLPSGPRSPILVDVSRLIVMRICQWVVYNALATKARGKTCLREKKKKKLLNNLPIRS